MDNANDEFISVGAYLTKGEVESIRSYFHSINIDCVINGHDAASRYRSLYYEIRVRKRDASLARQAILRQNAKAIVKNRRCPKCSSASYRVIQKNGFWEKLYYLGTTLAQCQKCKTKYPI